jgi:DNA-binding CsgD family transcriptional regulator
MAGIDTRVRLGDRLATTWSRTVDGGGRVVVLVGDAGIGKSSMLSALAERIGAPARIVSCRGGDVAEPMSTVVEIGRALGMSIASVSGGVEVDPLRAADVLRDALEKTRGVALLVDDIHDADPLSRTALNLALRRAVVIGVLVVVTGRRLPSVQAFAEGFEIDELEGLDDDSAAALLQSASDVRISELVMQRLLVVAAGNPLALTNLPKSLSREQLTGAQLLPDDIPLSGDLRTVFTRQLPPGGTPARELLDRAAVSADGAWAVLATRCPTDAEEALDGIESLGLARLRGGRLVLRHPLLRSAAVDAMSSARWRALNREFSAEPTIAPEVRLIYRARSAVGPDDQLVDELVTAAQVMRRRGGTDAAARLLDRAVDLTGDEGRRGRLRLQAAEVLCTAGETEAARRRLAAVLDDTGSGELHVAATLTLATLEALNGAPAKALQRLHECVPFATPSELGAVYARMAIPLGMLGLVAQIVETAEAAVEHAKPDSPEYSVAQVTLAHAASAQDEARAQSLVDCLLQSLDAAEVIRNEPMAGLHIGRALAIAERYDVAVSLLGESSARSRGEGARSSLAMIFGSLGETYVRSSRFDEALVCLDEATALSMATGQRAFAPFWLSLRARVHAVRGEQEAAAADLQLGFSISGEQSTFGARYFLLANAGLAALAAQRHEEAVAHLAECWAFEQAGGLLAPQLARWHVDLVEAYMAGGRPDDARPLVDHLIQVAGTAGASRWTRATACRAEALMLADTDPPRALECLGQAVNAYDPGVDCFDRARAFFDMARLARGHKARENARSEALFAFRRLGAAPWAARLAVPADDSGISALTGAERRVLDEVARGLTNQQIARHLQVSAKTVANHLYHVYRKLGVASRTEAARQLLLEQRRDPRGR